MRECEELIKCMQSRGNSQLNLASGDSLECVTRLEHARSRRIKTAGSLQDKKYSLAFLLSGNWNSQLILVASDLPVHPVLLKTDFHIPSHTLL